MAKALSKEQKLEIDSKLTKEFQEGIEAKKFVNNPLWIKANKAIEDMLIKQLKENKFYDFIDKNRRDDITRRLQLQEELKDYFENTITKGEEAKTRLEANNGSK